ncbi:hypothetical protein NDU88_005981 [Pleurodeles waltl]|uniref:Uncharacterized protein n=1 Tax=Pleurodeles waltl TaxID=8319 RepID=A0AAV7W9A9_PLEWA|nr:hypothetical protein NDU88_005981 [Pleurodeles waltl]
MGRNPSAESAAFFCLVDGLVNEEVIFFVNTATSDEVVVVTCAVDDAVVVNVARVSVITVVTGSHLEQSVNKRSVEGLIFIDDDSFCEVTGTEKEEEDLLQAEPEDESSLAVITVSEALSAAFSLLDP